MRKFLALFFLLLLGACGLSDPENEAGEKRSRRILPDSNGGILDMLVIAKPALWEGPAGDELRRHFTAMQYGLPQAEPRFTVRQVPPESYNDLLKRSRYQILLSLSDSTALFFREEQYAKKQFLVYAQAESPRKLALLLRGYQEKIRNEIAERERQRLWRRLKPLRRKSNSRVLAAHHVEFNVPKDFDLEVETDDFLLFWKKTATTDQGIFIHFRPFEEQEAFLGEEIIPLRDSLTKKYVQGQRPGSYMITEDLIKPRIEAMEWQDRFAMEARGLWRTEGDLMGGPFLGYTIYDEQNGQVVYLDAFLFAPDQKKRNQLFELEAVLRKLRFTEG